MAKRDKRFRRFDDGSVGEVFVMAVADDYAMVRRPSCTPFVIREDQLAKSPTIEDGFGSEWSAWCERCGRATMFVNRPGDARCSKCD